MVKRKKALVASEEEMKTTDQSTAMVVVEDCCSASASCTAAAAIGVVLPSTTQNSLPSSPRPSDSLCCNTRSKLKSTTVTVTTTENLANPQEPCLTLGDDGGEQKSGTKSAVGCRSSSRTPKRSCRDRDASPVQRNIKNQSKVVLSPPEQVRTRRSWELWSVQDKNAFFDALCEFGKDFESIHHFIAQKNKKKNNLAQMIKNKDQVRHFYYRTWHKISKYLEITGDIKKQTQELYGLINYGELRKKLGGRLDEKNGQKLNELVHNGATTIRFKGKNLRVKTPLCRALKRLNTIDDPKDDDAPKLPPKVTMELRPHDMSSWTRVQSLAQNPRLKLTISLQRRLETVLKFLQEKWKSQRLKNKGRLATVLGGGGDGNATEGDKEESNVLRLLPPSDCEINLVKVKPSNDITTTSASVSLDNYRHQVLTRTPTDCTTNKRPGASKNRTKTSDLLDPSVASKRHVSTIEDVDVAQSEPAVELTDQERLVKECVTLKEEEVSTNAQNGDGGRTELVVEGRVGEGLSVDRVRRGWTIQDCGGMTVGELFLMLGSPSKLVIEYVWESLPEESACKITTADVLRKLLQLAAVTFTDKNKQTLDHSALCRCGHVCPSAGSSCTGNSSVLHKASNVVRAPNVSRGTSKSTKTTTTTSTVPPSTPKPGVEATSVTPTLPQGTTSERMNATISSADQGLFVVPAAPQSKSSIGIHNNKMAASDKAFKEQLDKWLPSHRKSRGRIGKSVVVQRELPLLPKTSTTHSMMTLRIVPTTSQLAGSFVPVLSANALAVPSTVNGPQPKMVKLTPRVVSPASVSLTLPSVVTPVTPSLTLLSSSPLPSSTTTLTPTVMTTVGNRTSSTSTNDVLATSILELSIPELTSASGSGVTSGGSDSNPTFSASPPSVSLLDMALHSSEVLPPENVGLSSDLDLTLANSTSSFSGFNLEVSPMKDSSWETADLSLSSLLGNLDSPFKNQGIVMNPGTIITEENTCGRLSSDVENQLQCMLTESSVDYVAKFADLAAQIAVTDNHNMNGREMKKQ